MSVVNESPFLEAMTRTAREQCDRMLAEARREAEAIETEAKDRCVEERDNAIAEAKSRLARRRADARHAAETEANRIGRALEANVAEEVLAEAENAIRAVVESPDFPRIIETFLEEAVTGVDGNLQVLIPPAHATRVRRWLDAHGMADIEVVSEPDVTDGVMVQDVSRTFRITNTLTNRFDRLREKTRTRCIEILFRDGNEGPVCR